MNQIFPSPQKYLIGRKEKRALLNSKVEGNKWHKEIMNRFLYKFQGENISSAGEN